MLSFLFDFLGFCLSFCIGLVGFVFIVKITVDVLDALLK